MAVGKILLVEDEESLRALLAKYLGRLQYVVDAVATAEDACVRFEAAPAEYPLLIVDLTLPGMAGDEFARRALAASSSVRILLSSGYPYDTDAFPEEDRSRISFLQKPYLPRQLADQLTKMITPA